MRWLLYVLPRHGLHLSNNSGSVQEITESDISVESLGNGVLEVRDQVKVRELSKRLASHPKTLLVLHTSCGGTP